MNTETRSQKLKFDVFVLFWIEFQNQGTNFFAVFRPTCVKPQFFFSTQRSPENLSLAATPDRKGALEKIRLLEAPKGSLTDLAPDANFGLPVFVEHLNDVSCAENENIKFKCKVEPKNDPTLQIGEYLRSFLRTCECDERLRWVKMTRCSN